ncbi:SGNH/GDSL hydrolase family protein [Burkholderia sp. TSV86]|uniref:SGNH/GDSL hydrolase family protein n=1 Tax=Burkholderia sp. TSV86 TaxID=1385594 RepID=UPI00075BF9A3|nr:SGNH/GDSL hydrolase family protein [Burkholderia sp. TSV86]KVE36586.1 hypothetical protein WS68_03830 [Burkholderia sp. TSV86]
MKTTAHRHALRHWFYSVVYGIGIALSASHPAGAASLDTNLLAPHWVSAWATALEPIPDNSQAIFPTPDVGGRTFRQIVYPTLSGRAVRIRVSNAYSNAPLVIRALRIGQSAGGAALAANSSVAATFGGATEVTLSPGQELDTDPIPYAVKAGVPYALSLYLGDQQKMTVWHGVSNQVNYVSDVGDHTGDTAADAYQNGITHYAWMTELAVQKHLPFASTVAAIGDSLTDSEGSSVNLNRRWTDAFAARLAKVGAREIGVLNLGLTGNRLLNDSVCYGTAVENRFERDVLAHPGVKVVILQAGDNDIGFAAAQPQPGLDCLAPHKQGDFQSLVDGYQRIIAVAHQHGISVIGATLAPALLSPAPLEQTRQQVNTWIRTSGAFDGIADFDAALRDPANPSVIQARYLSSDGLHPNDAGYAAVANAVPLWDVIIQSLRYRR